MLSFKPAVSLSSFTFIKRLFSSSSLPAIRVVSSAYLKLLIFLPPKKINFKKERIYISKIGKNGDSLLAKAVRKKIFLCNFGGKVKLVQLF